MLINNDTPPSKLFMFTRHKHIVKIVSISFLLLAVSACGTNSEPSEDYTPISEMPADYNSINANVPNDPFNFKPENVGPIIGGIHTLSELSSDANGQWRKSSILPQDTSYNYSYYAVDSSTKKIIPQEDIDKAHKMSVQLLTDVIDTSANGAPEDLNGIKKWWSENETRFHSSYKDEAYRIITSPPQSPNFDDRTNTYVTENTILYKPSHRINYELAYGEDKTHISFREIGTRSITADENTKNITVSLVTKFNNAIILDGSSTNEGVEGNISYTFKKDETTGELLVIDTTSTYFSFLAG